jgi:hypothetical protein
MQKYDFFLYFCKLNSHEGYNGQVRGVALCGFLRRAMVDDEVGNRWEWPCV